MHNILSVKLGNVYGQVRCIIFLLYILIVLFDCKNSNTCQ